MRACPCVSPWAYLHLDPRGSPVKLAKTLDRIKMRPMGDLNVTLRKDGRGRRFPSEALAAAPVCSRGLIHTLTRVDRPSNSPKTSIGLKCELWRI